MKTREQLNREYRDRRDWLTRDFHAEDRREVNRRRRQAQLRTTVARRSAR